jgi:hypothetical protein
MNNIVFRKVYPEDYAALRLHSCFSGDTDAIGRAREMVKSPWCLSYTIIGPDKNPLAIMGGFYIYNKVLELWALVDQRVELCPVYYAKATKFLISHEFDRLKVNRMQVFMRVDQRWAKHWAEVLGFQQEGILRKYGAEGTDYYLFAKVR